MVVFALDLSYLRFELDPIMSARYCHYKNSLDSGLFDPSLLRSDDCFHLNSKPFAPEVGAPTVALKYFHSHIAPISSDLQNSFVDRTPLYHFPLLAVPVDFVTFCSHLLLFLPPFESRKKLQYPEVRIDAIVPRVLEGTLSSGRGTVFDYLECAQDLLSPET